MVKNKTSGTSNLRLGNEIETDSSESDDPRAPQNSLATSDASNSRFGSEIETDSSESDDPSVSQSSDESDSPRLSPRYSHHSTSTNDEGSSDLEDENTSVATSDVNPLDDGDVEDSPIVHNDENSSVATSGVNPLDEGDVETDVEGVGEDLT